MAPEPKKTNACRILDEHGVAYTLRSYEATESDLAAPSVARKIGLPAEQVFKTLCVRAPDRSVVLAVVPGDSVLDLKALAQSAHKKSLSPVAVKELSELTGYVRGGVSALGGKRPYPVFIDETAFLFDVISVSAGQRGLQILLPPGEFVRVTGAVSCAIAREAAK